MIRIKTNKEVTYDARTGKVGKLVLDLELKTGIESYQATIRDYVEKTLIVKNDEGASTNYLELICSKEVQIPVAQIDGLFEAIKDLVDDTLPYTEIETERKKLAFLIYVQNDFIKDEAGKAITGKTIYNLNPEDWELD